MYRGDTGCPALCPYIHLRFSCFTNVGWLTIDLVVLVGVDGPAPVHVADAADAGSYDGDQDEQGQNDDDDEDELATRVVSTLV